ncbi:unnamed protein product [Periconia digitata]|uniref:Uncharacterized protein n=1 Tax=Periconia digitata TaxID=1303443 RepID=A0A9W4XJT5_9PLEO|nr:unnamed protein product [Periconia digitata]
MTPFPPYPPIRCPSMSLPPIQDESPKSILPHLSGTLLNPQSRKLYEFATSPFHATIRFEATIECRPHTFSAHSLPLKEKAKSIIKRTLFAACIPNTSLKLGAFQTMTFVR